MSDVALYFPYVNFRDETWLKLSVLYWDTIWRITSEDARRFDPPTYWQSEGRDMQLLEGEGIVRPYVPDVAVEHAPLATLWEELVQQHGAELERRYRLDLDAREDLDDERRGYFSSPLRKKKGVGWLLTGKMEPHLLRIMSDAGLAVVGEDVGAPGWIAFDVQVLDVYMTSLANQIVGDKAIETVTDVPKHFLRFSENSVDALRDALLPDKPARPQPTSLDPHARVMALAVEAVSPAGIEALDMPQILQLRKASLDARARFKTAAKAMVDELEAARASSLDGTLHPSELDALRQKHIDQPLDELRKKLRSSNGDAVMSVLTLKSLLQNTVGATVLAGLGADPTVIAAAGIALGLFQIVRGAKKARQDAKKSPLGWLLDIEARADAAQALQATGTRRAD